MVVESSQLISPPSRNPLGHLSTAARTGMCLQAGGDQSPCAHQTKPGRGEGHDAREQECIPFVWCRWPRPDRPAAKGGRAHADGGSEGVVQASVPGVEARLRDPDASGELVQGLLEGRRDLSADSNSRGDSGASAGVAEDGAQRP